MDIFWIHTNLELHFSTVALINYAIFPQIFQINLTLISAYLFIKPYTVQFIYKSLKYVPHYKYEFHMTKIFYNSKL